MRKIVNALSDVLPSGPAPRPRRHANLEAYEYFVRGRGLVLQSAEGSREGLSLLYRAAELDPGFAEPHAWVAMSLVHGWLHWGLPMTSVQQALDTARRGVELDPQNADAHAFLAYVLNYDRKPKESEAEFSAALSINPNHADALALRAEVLLSFGRYNEAAATIELALRLNPYPPHWYFWMLGLVRHAAGRYAEAVEALQHESTRRTPSQRILAASLAQLDRIDEAREVAKSFLVLHPGFRIAEWIAAQPLPQEAATRFAEGYRLAGLPE